MMLNSILMVLKDATKDTVLIIPILYIVYLLVEYFHASSHLNSLKKSKTGPLVGASLGILPQCGFSVAMADLYNKNSITLGTLIAVFIATSDEAIPIMLANPKFIPAMIVMLAIKFVYALLVGYLIDFIVKKWATKPTQDISTKECAHNHLPEGNIFIEAFWHTAKITLYIFVVNLVFASINEFSGFDISFLSRVNRFVQPFLTSLIGLIPNCISSIILVEAYMAGGITFGALLAGLATGAGVGLMVLFKRNKKYWLKNLLILALVYVLGILLGEIISLLGVINV